MAVAVFVTVFGPGVHNLFLILIAIAAGGFAAAYVVGVAVVVAPAGVGAREVTLVALLSPAVGLATATAVALVTRVLHTAADLTLAAVSALRRGRSPAVQR